MNNFILPEIVAREALEVLTNSMVIGSLVYKNYAQDFTGDPKIGDTIKIRRPAELQAHSFKDQIAVQSINESYIQLSLEELFDVSVELGPRDLTLSINDFSNQVVAPAMLAMGRRMDSYLMSKVQQFSNYIGTPGTPPSSIGDIAAVNRRLNEQLAPPGKRIALVSPRVEQSILSIPNLSKVDEAGNSDALRDAAIGRVMGIDFYMTQSIPTHISGTQGGVTGPVVSGTTPGQAFSFNVTGGGNAATLLQGDVFSVAGCYLPNRPNVLAEFVVTANNTANSSGAFTNIQFAPAAPGPGFVAGSAVSFQASHEMNFVMAGNAMAMISVPLARPLGTDKVAVVSDPTTGVSIRVVYGYDQDSKRDTISFDCLVGAKVIDPRLALRWMA